MLHGGWHKNFRKAKVRHDAKRLGNTDLESRRYST